MNENVKVVEKIHSDSMMQNGWVVVVSLAERNIHYGPFATKENAIEYGKKMINATIYAIFFPTLH